jgi:hypothetical protein
MSYGIHESVASLDLPDFPHSVAIVLAVPQ